MMATDTKAARLRALDRRHRELLTVIAARAADPIYSHVPGGSTGMLVRTERTIGDGPDTRTIEEFALDVATLAELRALEAEAARLTGGLPEKE